MNISDQVQMPGWRLVLTLITCTAQTRRRAQDALQGLTAAGAYLDEAALFPKSFVDQAIARCSVDGWKFWMNCNPAGPHHFIREEYLTEEAMKQKKVYHLHFTMDDNLSISPKRKEEYKNAWPHGSVFYQAFYPG